MSNTIKDFLQGRGKITQSPDLKIKVEGKSLSIHYPSKTWRSVYDISDLNGRILKRGEILQDQPETLLSLEELKAGNYVLWIVDGADLFRLNFQLN